MTIGAQGTTTSLIATLPLGETFALHLRGFHRLGGGADVDVTAISLSVVYRF